MLTGTLDPISNLATWRERFELKDDDDDSLMDLETDVDEITISIRPPASSDTILQATLSGATVEVVSLGILEFVFTAAQMADLRLGTYEIGCLVQFSSGVGGDTEQVVLGYVPVLRGL